MPMFVFFCIFWQEETEFEFEEEVRVHLVQAVLKSDPIAFLQSELLFQCILCSSDAVVVGRLPKPLGILRPFLTSAELCHFHPCKFPK